MNHGGGKVMVWGCVTSCGFGWLVCVNGNMNTSGFSRKAFLVPWMTTTSAVTVSISNKTTTQSTHLLQHRSGSRINTSHCSDGRRTALIWTSWRMSEINLRSNTTAGNVMHGIQMSYSRCCRRSGGNSSKSITVGQKIVHIFCNLRKIGKLWAKYTSKQKVVYGGKKLFYVSFMMNPIWPCLDHK